MNLFFFTTIWTYNIDWGGGKGEGLSENRRCCKLSPLLGLASSSSCFMLQCGRRIIGDWDRDCLLHVSDIHCERPMFDCRSCGARYKHESTMMRHRKKCEGCYNISCYICGKCFYRKDHCTSHLVHKHKIEATFHWWYREKAKDKAGSRYAGHFPELLFSHQRLSHFSPVLLDGTFSVLFLPFTVCQCEVLRVTL